MSQISQSPFLSVSLSCTWGLWLARVCWVPVHMRLNWIFSCHSASYWFVHWASQKNQRRERGLQDGTWCVMMGKETKWHQNRGYSLDPFNLILLHLFPFSENQKQKTWTNRRETDFRESQLVCCPSICHYQLQKSRFVSHPATHTACLGLESGPSSLAKGSGTCAEAGRLPRLEPVPLHRTALLQDRRVNCPGPFCVFVSLLTTEAQLRWKIRAQGTPTVFPGCLYTAQQPRPPNVR